LLSLGWGTTEPVAPSWKVEADQRLSVEKTHWSDLDLEAGQLQSPKYLGLLRILVKYLGVAETCLLRILVEASRPDSAGQYEIELDLAVGLGR
jgi:hypothetical protein